MRKFLIMLFALSMTQTAANADSGVLSGGVRKGIKNYFSKSLTGESAAYDGNKKISAKNIAEYRSAVWSVWQEAVNNFVEDKLIPLQGLDKKEAGAWNIPEQLEPHAVMPYYWGTAGDCNGTDKLPMFLYMHGSGHKDSEWSTGYRLCTEVFYNPAIYFIPQIPNMGEYYRWAIPSKQWTWEKLLRLAFLNDKVDANRIYFFGISEGGYGSQRLAAFYADYLAAAGPMAGGEPLKNAPMENVANIGFSLRTGEYDYAFGRNMLTANALRVADSLQNAHPGLYNHYIEIVPGRGHGIDYSPTTPWLAKFTRNPHPRYFYWEDYEMYGRHRTGFYNLRVNESSRNNDEERTCYELSIDGNTVNLNVQNVNYTTTKSLQGIPMLFDKKYSAPTKGSVTIYLNENLVDLSKPVKVILNGKEVFNGKVKSSLKNMVESCALFFDPERLFPAAIDVKIE